MSHDQPGMDKKKNTQVKAALTVILRTELLLKK